MSVQKSQLDGSTSTPGMEVEPNASPIVQKLTKIEPDSALRKGELDVTFCNSVSLCFHKSLIDLQCGNLPVGLF